MLHHNSAIFRYVGDLSMLQYTLYYFLGAQSEAGVTIVEEQCMKALLTRSCALLCHSCLGFLGWRRKCCLVVKH